MASVGGAIAASSGVLGGTAANTSFAAELVAEPPGPAPCAVKTTGAGPNAHCQADSVAGNLTSAEASSSVLSTASRPTPPGRRHVDGSIKFGPPLQNGADRTTVSPLRLRSRCELGDALQCATMAANPLAPELPSAAGGVQTDSRPLAAPRARRAFWLALAVVVG